MCLKHLGFSLLPMIRGFSNFPDILTVKAMVSRSFDFLPPTHASHLKESDFAGRDLKKTADSSMFRISSSLYPEIRSGNLLLKSSTQSGFTEPLSPQTVLHDMLCLCLNLSNHPFEALKLSRPSLAAISRAFSCRRGPDTGMSWAVFCLNHSKTAQSNCPYKERYIAGSATCSTKSLSKRLTIILSAIKNGLQTYCETAYSHSGINQMWILKNSKELLDNLQSQTLNRINSIQTFDFSTLYTTIPHSNLKQRISDIVKQAFVTKSGKRRFTYLALNSSKAFFVKDNSSCKVKYTEDDIISMINFLIDNIFVQFGGRIYQQTIGIPMGTNCAPLLADLFLYTYEAEFIQNLIKQGEKTTARSFNYTFRYIDDVLSLNNTNFENYLHRIYPSELEIKNTTVSSNSASYLDLFLEYDKDSRLTCRLYDKRDDFDFPIVNFPFLDSNIPSSPAYGVYISQLIRYSRACSNYHDFLKRTITLTDRLLRQGFMESKLKEAEYNNFCPSDFD